MLAGVSVSHRHVSSLYGCVFRGGGAENSIETWYDTLFLVANIIWLVFHRYNTIECMSVSAQFSYDIEKWLQFFVVSLKKQQCLCRRETFKTKVWLYHIKST